MKYSILYDKKAIKEIKKINKELFKRIVKKLRETENNPHKFFERMVEFKMYKLRVGDYRIIADIDNSKKQIKITKIGHRKNIYS